MRTIEQSVQFRRDLKREYKGRHRAHLEGTLREVLALLVEDRPMPAALRDHPLTGKWKSFRDCHVRPDLVLIYRKPDPDTLELLRLGSHSELGL
jgi:mRNA interferase YafQ